MMLFLHEGSAGIMFWYEDGVDEQGNDSLNLMVKGEDNSFHEELDIDSPVHVLYKGIEAALMNEEHVEGLFNLGTVAIMNDINEVLARAKERVTTEDKPKRKKAKKKEVGNVVKHKFGKEDPGENPDT